MNKTWLDDLNKDVTLLQSPLTQKYELYCVSTYNCIIYSKMESLFHFPFWGFHLFLYSRWSPRIRYFSRLDCDLSSSLSAALLYVP